MDQEIIKAINLVTKGARVKRCKLPIGIMIDDKVAWLGKDTKEASITVNITEETYSTVWCETQSDITDLNLEIEFAPFTLRGGGEAGATELAISKIQRQLMNAVFNEDYEGFKLPVVIGFGFSGEDDDSIVAIKYSESLIIPSEIGGGATADMPIKIKFAGSLVVGTVDKIPPQAEEATFTPSVTP